MMMNLDEALAVLRYYDVNDSLLTWNSHRAVRDAAWEIVRERANGAIATMLHHQKESK